MTTTTKKTLLIAMVCHAVNASIQAAAGQAVLLWDEAPEEIRQSAIVGVQYHLSNPEATPEQSHEAWLKHRGAAGWVYGEVKDLEKKTHPCFLPYADLPFEEKVKDHTFRAVVHAMNAIPLELLEAEVAAVARPAPGQVNEVSVPQKVLAPAGFMPITYIGKRSPHREGAYGTGLMFERGQTLPVPTAIAGKLLAHPDVYKLGVIEEVKVADVDAAEAGKSTQAEADKHEQDLQDTRDAIGRFNSKKGVAAFVKTNFNQDLDERSSLADLKTQAVGLLERFGMPQ